MTARISPPWPARSPWPSPSMFRRRTMTGPSTGCFHTPVWTVRPRQATSRGRPTFTDTSRPTDRSSMAPRPLRCPDPPPSRPRLSGDGGADQLGDLLLHLRAPPRERVRHRPDVAVVEARRVLEAQGGVAVVELAGVLEE